MYYLDSTVTPPVYRVVYWDGSTWGNEAAIELEFDGGTPSAALHDCLGNIDAIVYAPTGGPVYEGAFFGAIEGSPCFTGGGGIIFAEHRN